MNEDIGKDSLHGAPLDRLDRRILAALQSNGRVSNQELAGLVHLSPAQFASLSTGKVELAKLVADGAARCEGEHARLENVSLVLAFLERG